MYSTESVPGSLDEHLKTFLKRTTAGWVAVVLFCGSAPAAEFDAFMEAFMVGVENRFDQAGNAGDGGLSITYRCFTGLPRNAHRCLMGLIDEGASALGACESLRISLRFIRVATDGTSSPGLV